MKLHHTGFTLAELLVVVVIIGILSAVVLPKFTKMMDAYKTAEAEHMLEAVRSEQESRAAFEGPSGYTTDGTQIGAFVADETDSTTFTSKNFVYILQDGFMTAQSRNSSLSYTLSIDYATGVICCSGVDCGQLEKGYSSCGS